MTSYLKIYDKPAVYGGLALAAFGIMLFYQGDMGWIFGLPFIAAAIGCVAAGFTRCKP